MDSSSAAAASSTSVFALLAGKDDRYGGFIIDPLALPAHPQDFACALRNSLAHWKSQGKKGIWLKLPIKNAKLVPLAVEEGFFYHHAERDYVMLTFWIPEVPSTIPANASHQVGVGAIIVNEKNEVLVVQEITGPTQGSAVWTTPTGVVNQGENILDAVSREIKEKTGVETKFIEVLGIRQSHDEAFGKSELFFLCKLRPLSLEINIQKTEISAAKWMPKNEYWSQPLDIHKSQLCRNILSSRIVDITIASIEGTYQGFGTEMLTFGFQNKRSYFYHNIRDISKFLALFEHY